jgi:FkbM family methyltransferase
MITIFYGVNDNKRDVTQVCLDRLKHNNVITIPKGDITRASFFSDHLVGIKKYIFIVANQTEVRYDQTYTIKIDITTSSIDAKQDITTSSIDAKQDITNDQKIYNMHNNLKIKYGSFNEELPEQKMAVRYLTGSEKVLEIGGNIGRNSLIIASIVDNSNFVSLESDIAIAHQLRENRGINNKLFHVENSALSKRKLIQRGWDTKPSDILEPGYKWVNILTVDELKQKYNIVFDTLVLDCEGAFYYILMDMPEILDNIKLIIMENDYHDIDHKTYIDTVLKNNNFYVDYSEAGGWGCCYNNFFEVWKRA